MTDNRLLFDSDSKPIRIPFRSIISWKATTDSIKLAVTNKPELKFYFPPNSEPLLAEKFTTLVQLHSQVLRRKVEGQIDRHISRDIRQRVWQRYGGKCAECGATDYLEFDHIVPVAKAEAIQNKMFNFFAVGAIRKSPIKSKFTSAFSWGLFLLVLDLTRFI